MKLKDLVSRTKKIVSGTESNSRPGKSGDDVSGQRFGLFELNTGDNATTAAVDVVVIHGLGGHRTRTWQHAETKAYWPQDFLPSDVPNARIMVYGYNSAVAFSKSISGIDDFARDLLERLKVAREACNAGTRPIIFVCHSMGGLVVKKALVLAHERWSTYGSVADCVFGVVFLATPHRGSGFAAPAELVSRIFRAAQLRSRTNTKLLTSLRRDGDILWDISSQFVDRSVNLQIRTFYETEPMPLMNSLVVEKSSAVLHHPNESAVPVRADHRTICQFSHRDCQNYSVVSAAIQELCAKALVGRAGARVNDASVLATIQRFHKSDYQAYKAALDLPVQDTCVWFLKDPSYVEWIRDPKSSLLWISGDPGCGKTTLARFLVDKIQPQFPMEAALCYFFFDEKVEAQSDGSSLLLACIHQLLKANPELVTTVEHHLGLSNSQLALSLHNLWEMFRSMVAEARPRRIVCLVDALDECEAGSMSKVIRWISSLISDYNQISDPSMGGWFKVGVTSRRYQTIDDLFRTVPHLRIRLDEHVKQTNSDIETFIKARCARIQDVTFCSSDMRRTIERRLLERSDRTFLWISLVLDILQTDTDSSEESFDRIFTDLPEELDGVYERILQRSTEPKTLLRVLSIIAASRRSLTLSEMNTALAVRPGDTSRKDVERRHQFDISRRLYGVCGPFIRISNDAVSFIHQTAKEFLIRPQAIERPVGQHLKYKHCLDTSGVNRCLAEICVVDLSISDADSPGGLFDYAAIHWGIHCRFANVKSDSDELFSKAMNLCSTQTDTFRNWFQLYWSIISDVHQFPDGLTSLMLASHLGLHSVVSALLGAGPANAAVNAQDVEGWAPIHWAVWNGYGNAVDSETVELLLQFGASIDLQDKKGLTALHWAAADGQDDVVKMLLEAGAEVDMMSRDGMTPLALAVENEVVGAVEILLEHGADVDAAEECEDSPMLEGTGLRDLGSHGKMDLDE